MLFNAFAIVVGQFGVLALRVSLILIQFEKDLLTRQNLSHRLESIMSKKHGPQNTPSLGLCRSLGYFSSQLILNL